MARRMAAVGFVTVSLLRSIKSTPMNSAKTSLESMTPRDVRRSARRRIVPAGRRAMNWRIGIRERIASGPSMPSVRRRPRKKRSAPGPLASSLASQGPAPHSPSPIPDSASAIRAVEGMRVGAEAEVRLALPVFQVVARFEARPGEVGNLVARIPRPAPGARRRFHRSRRSIVLARHCRARRSAFRAPAASRPRRLSSSTSSM